MKILYLYNNPIALPLFEWLQGQNHDIISSSTTITSEYVLSEEFDLIISYTYRYIINEETIQAVRGNVVNLHISYLPWNRGANPNQWSLIENTPTGVTIHYINPEIDKGDIIVQKLVPISETDTLADSYQTLNREITELFKTAFAFYPHWEQMRKKPLGKGSYHKLSDYNKYKDRTDYQMTTKEFKEMTKGKV